MLRDFSIQTIGSKIMHMYLLNKKSLMNNIYFLPKIQLHVDEL
jgi:hypothetical protein